MKTSVSIDPVTDKRCELIRPGRARTHTLRSLHLLRTRDAGGQSRLECCHDRVREIDVPELLA